MKSSEDIREMKLRAERAFNRESDPLPPGEDDFDDMLWGAVTALEWALEVKALAGVRLENWIGQKMRSARK